MNSVVHFEMPAKDKVRVSKFYSQAFGWKMETLGQEMGEYVLATTTEPGENGRPKNPGAINGGFFQWQNKPGFQQPSVVIGVDDLDAAIEAVKAAGGKVMDGPMDIPGIGKFCSIEDTEGNRVGVLQPSM